MRLLALVALLGCAPKSAPQDALPSPGVVRLLLAPELPPLCVSDGGPDTPKDGRAARQAALVRLQAGDAAGARAALGTVDASPAADVLRAVAALYDGDLRGARALLRDVGVALPADGCVQEALALLAVLDNASGQARVHAADAWRLQPTAPEAGALYAQILQRAGAADEAARVLREVIQVAPTHPLSNLLLARFYLDRGDALLALPLLAHAQAGGLPVGPLQLRAAWGAGDLPAYLRAASAAGLPLGDQGALATAGDPVGAYRALVGLGDGQDTLTLRIDTRVGPLDCELFWRDAPVTVASFVGLARGTIGWVHPDTGAAMAGTPLYDGTVMHRVIPELAIASRPGRSKRRPVLHHRGSHPASRWKAHHLRRLHRGDDPAHRRPRPRAARPQRSPDDPGRPGEGHGRRPLSVPARERGSRQGLVSFGAGETQVSPATPPSF